MSSSKVLLLRSNPVAPDPRVEKTASVLTQAGYEVTIVCWDRTAELPQIEQKDFAKIERIRIKASYNRGLANLLTLMVWELRLLFWLLFNARHFQIIHACDFDTVMPALIVRMLYGQILIYDIFDFYADFVIGLPTFLRRTIRKLDYWVISRVDAVIIADESRLEQISGSKPRKLIWIYNSPPQTLSSVSGNASKQGQVKVAFVGLLQPSRGIEHMIEVVKANPNWELTLAGFGGYEDQLAKKVRGIANIHFFGRLSYDEAIKIYASSDVMFATYDPAIPNHRYSSANKLFEAMMLGKPIIVARNTSMDRLVEKYNLGFVIDYGHIDQLGTALDEVAWWSEQTKQAFADRVSAIYQEHFSWETMSKKLLGLYEDLTGDL